MDNNRRYHHLFEALSTLSDAQDAGGAQDEVVNYFINHAKLHLREVMKDMEVDNPHIHLDSIFGPDREQILGCSLSEEMKAVERSIAKRSKEHR